MRQYSICAEIMLNLAGKRAHFQRNRCSTSPVLPLNFGGIRTGASFGKIASALGVSVNTVKSYCKRNPMSAEVASVPRVPSHSGRCPQCGALLKQSPGHRQKRFCSPKCRMAWWSEHPEQMVRKNMSPVECLHCETVFLQYGNRPRKFCSRGCYLAHRYGQGGDTHG